MDEPKKKKRPHVSQAQSAAYMDKVADKTLTSPPPPKKKSGPVARRVRGTA